MDKILTHDYLELLAILTSIESDSSLNRQFKINIRKLYNVLSESGKYSELYEFLCETAPNLSSCVDTIDFVSNNELCELFVEWILFLLEFYSLCLTKEMRTYRIKCKHSVTYALKNYAPDVLTPSESVGFNLAMDFVFILGIAPQLLPGIYDSTTKSYEMIIHSFRVLPNLNKNINLLKKSLNITVDLFETKMSIMFKEYIITNHFKCYLMALVQICFCPDTITKAGWRNKGIEVERYSIYLKSLIDQSPRKFIFRTLISLLSNNNEIPGKITPRWLAESCGQFMRDCIMRDEGVKSLILSYVDDDDDHDQMTYLDHDPNHKPSCIDWEKCYLISKLVTDCPLGEISDEFYCASVFQQIHKLIQILYYTEPSTLPSIIRPNNRSMVPIFVNIVSSMWQDHQSLFDEIILKNVAKPLYICTLARHSGDLPLQSDDEFNAEVVNERDFSMCIETLYEVLIMFKTPRSKFCLCLLPLIDVLFELHLFLSINPSYLSSSVESLLQETMNLLDRSQSLAIIKYFAELERDLSIFTGWKAIKPMNKSFKFASGVAGGVRIVLKRTNEKSSNLSIFNTINWKISLLTNLIHNMEDSVSGNICQSCIEHLTKVIFHDIEAGFTSKRTVGHQCLLLLTGILEKGKVVGGDQLDKIFLFSKVVIEKTLKYYKIYNGVVHYEDLSADDFQRDSLSLVLGILSCFVLEQDQIPQSVLNLSEDMVSPLKCLYMIHPDEHVQTLVFELLRTITAHTQGHLIRDKMNLIRIMSRDQVKKLLIFMKERNIMKDINCSIGQNIPLSLQSTRTVTPGAGLKIRKIFNFVKPSEMQPRGQGEGLSGVGHQAACNTGDAKATKIYGRKKTVRFVD